MTTPDPCRALDGVDVPDRWDDIVERAAEPASTSLVDHGSRFGPRRPVLLAAAVLALVALAGGAVALATRGDDGGEQVAAGPEDAATTSASAAGSGLTFWGQRWLVTELVRDGRPIELRPVSVGEDGETEPMALDATGSTAGAGLVRLNGSCAAARSGNVEERDGVLVAEAASWQPGVVCAMGDLAAEQNHVAVDLLLAGPTVTIEDRTLTLTVGDDRLVATAAQQGAATEDLSFWGRRWAVSSVTSDGVSYPARPESGESRGTSMVLDATDVPAAGEGTLRLPGTCASERSGRVELGDDGRLVADADSWAQGEVCPERDVNAGVTGMVVAVLLAGPTVTVDGDRLVLVSGDDRLEATAIPSTDDEGEDEPAGPTTTLPPASTSVPEGPTTTAPPTTTMPPTTAPPTTTPTITLPPPAPGEPLPPSAFFGTTWRVVAASEGGSDRSFPTAVITAGELRVDVSGGCNGQGGELAWDGPDRLVLADGWFSTAAGCAGPQGEALMAQDEWFQELFRGGVTVEVTTTGATVTGTDRSVVLRAA